jgi:hypothetical protein
VNQKKYEKPQIKELGTFKELTLRTTGEAKNGAKNDGKGLPATRA